MLTPVTTQRFEDFIKAHQREHELIKEAVDEARDSVNLRLEGMNELRAQIDKERGQYVIRTAYDTYKDAQEQRLNKIEKSLATMQSANTTWLIAIGIFFTIVQIVLRFVPLGKP
jgi:CHASE3 domain sensor protein